MAKDFLGNEFESKIDRLDGIFAYDTGCASGIKDDNFKNNLTNDPDELELLLTGLAKRYLNQGCTIADIKNIIEWSEQELDFYF